MDEEVQWANESSSIYLSLRNRGRGGDYTQACFAKDIVVNHILPFLALPPLKWRIGKWKKMIAMVCKRSQPFF